MNALERFEILLKKNLNFKIQGVDVFFLIGNQIWGSCHDIFATRPPLGRGEEKRIAERGPAAERDEDGKSPRLQL